MFCYEYTQNTQNNMTQNGMEVPILTLNTHISGFNFDDFKGNALLKNIK